MHYWIERHLVLKPKHHATHKEDNFFILDLILLLSSFFAHRQRSSHRLRDMSEVNRGRGGSGIDILHLI